MKLTLLVLTSSLVLATAVQPLPTSTSQASSNSSVASQSFSSSHSSSQATFSSSQSSRSSSSQSASSSSSTSKTKINEQDCCNDNEHYVNNETVCSRTCNSEAVICDITTGCVCNDGFVRNDGGDCVDVNTCPQCNEDEEYQSCGTCEDTCDNYDDTCRACAAVCYSGCYCKNNTIRDVSGACVTKDKCPPRTCPGPNEISASCPANCPPQNCSSINATFNCPLQPADCCTPQCVCESGYLRDDNTGVCILETQCPNYPSGDGGDNCTECGQDEIYTNCTRRCPNTCSQLLSNFPCPRILVAIPCNLPGCVCKENWLKNSDGVCVPPSECGNQTTCPPNEMQTDCANECFTGTCATRIRKPQACPQSCAQGCTCIDGYLRDDNGTCVPIDQCSPPNCNVNEEYNSCGTASEETCENYENPPEECTDQCVEDCFCKEGFVRASNGTCVMPDQCCQQCGTNEIYTDCTRSKCHKTCSDFLSNKLCPRIDARVPCNLPGCVCKDDWVENNYGVCVPTNVCVTPTTCPPNETPTGCANECFTGTCATRIRKPQACPQSCGQGCTCIDGYLRDDNGTCVPIDQCSPPNCNENEEYNSCGTACEVTCDNYENPPQVCTKQCVQNCFCKEGFVRASNGTCVIPDQCTIQRTCPPNETPTECENDCFTGTCATRIRKPQVCPQFCLVGCTCIDGYLKNDNGTCVPIDECSPPNCNENEEYNSCGTACEVTCDNFDNPPQVCTRQCVENCFCKKGFVRASNGTCVRPDQCGQQCGTDQIYSNCTRSKCHKTCSDFESNRLCPRIDARVPCNLPGCVCKDDWVLNSQGVCVPTSECAGQQCGTDEIYTNCTRSKCFKTCISLRSDIACPIFDPSVPCNLTGCVCKDDWVKNSEDVCVPRSECASPTCNENEEYNSCGTACEVTCDNYENPPEACTAQCVAKCFCKEGFVRASNGTCVMPDQCDATQQCGVNEQLVECANPCAETSCRYRLGPKRFCPAFICKSGCVCKEGTYRHDNNTCVPVNECSPPDCMQNAQYEKCGTACPLTCENYNNPPQVCTYNCVEGCFCTNNTVKLDDGTCIDPNQCPITCGDNEVYVENSTTCDRTCSTKDESSLCGYPYTGCQCITGYFRDCDGKCIEESCCPTPPTPNPCCENEIWSACRILCGGQTCASLYTTYTCTQPQPQEPGCDCKPNYLRNGNDTDECIFSDQCPGPTRFPVCEEGTHVYSPGCDYLTPEATCEQPNPQEQKDGILCDYTACYCDPPTMRDTVSQKCVKLEECPKTDSITCGDNEIYVENSTTCDRTCSTKDESSLCGYQYTGCQCISGYVRDCDGNCIEESCCPTPPTPNPCCENEIWSACRILCGGQTCASLYTTYTCTQPQPQEPGCDCKPNYLRNGTDTDECIFSDQCPGPTRVPVCEEGTHLYSPDCDYVTPEATCDQPNPQEQTDGKICDYAACYCDYPTVRDTVSQKCVKLEDCPKTDC